MKLKFAFLNLFLGCISLVLINTKFTSNVKGEELQKVELNNEIKKGKFLIGLRFMRMESLILHYQHLFHQLLLLLRDVFLILSFCDQVNDYGKLFFS